MEIPDVGYLERSDGVYIAYRVGGEGPIDVGWHVGDGTSLA